MIKKIKVGEVEMPVPVPLTNLAEAVRWVLETFGKKDLSVLTSVTLDGKGFDLDSQEWNKPVKLDEESHLEVHIDNPKGLGSKTVDVLRNLAIQITSTLQDVAIEYWDENKETKNLRVLEEVIADLTLVIELINHLNGIFDHTTVDMAPINGIRLLLTSGLVNVQTSIKEKNWKNVAHYLLNRVEHQLKELISESETLQISILNLNISQDLIAGLQAGQQV